jgi:hypothetical protein
MSRLWVDPPEGWKHGFPAIYDPETDGQMSEWIVNKGYPVQTIKEYGEQWHIRCWPAEEPEKYPDQVINAQKHSEVIKNTPIGTKMRKTTREEKISKPAVYEVPEETPQQRTWVGLIPEEIDEIIENAIDKVDALIQTMDKLKEKNNG